ncbi:LOW QUALITY PROTEIN: putative late blight resistance protein homolog R1A-10 [Lycium ferocissimum]|uniref:LOW QUALITY PROTEIN: putative late blight resistance protein homolog R1A-10 n=1 Tax=Lycium ferocissimum TaxID=112874 RepID=UPI002816232B|nr:LOW QUALITY PROTEIN: putative late blight resistance protein homolog R1A-10 [Lycium ferocissimum]
MAAYIAVISLLQTIEQFQQRHPELVQGFTAKTLESLHETAEYFQNVVEEAGKSKFDPEKKKSLEEKIRAAASYAEDIVEMKICQIIEDLNLKYGMAPTSSLYKNLLPFVERVERKKNEVLEIVSDFSTRIHDDQILESAGDSLIGASSRSNPMLQHLEDDIVRGLDDDLEIIVKRLTGRSSNLDIVTITGMGGIGKTTLARKAHDHITIKNHFDLRIWVTISQEYGSRNVLLEALRCISKNNDIEKDYDKKNDCELADLVQKKLKGPRYLVVVDDIWSTDVWDSIKGIFPDYCNKSRILLTTRESKVAMYANPISPHEMKLLNLENSWKLLCDKVFGPKHDHPPELEEIGKKIAEKCQGLPLTISVIAGHLSKVAGTLGSWEDVTRTLGEIIASQTGKCSGVLGLSYHYLPNHLKPCFLSMGGFPEDYQVETWRLIQLWIAEGFIRRPGSYKSLEEVAEDYLEDLISRNLIIVRKKRFNGEIKTCGMHDLLREFCLTEVKMTKFMHVEITDKVPAFMHDEITDIVPTLPAQKHNGRRFSFQMHGYSVDDCCKLLPSIARSIYLFSNLQSSVNFEFFSRFNLLRVLAIVHEYERFCTFPLVITKLFHLRYLQVQSYGNLPGSISELQNLQTLIYEGQHDHTTLPGKIWMMKNLRHIHTRDTCYLPSPRRKSISNKHLVIGMPNIEKLSNLCFTSCTNEIFSLIPNLRRLIVHHKGGRANRLIDMSILKKLEAFKFVIDAFWSSPPPISIKQSVLPASIKRLTLSGGFCFPWEDMSTLVMLPNLQELKLKNRAAYGKIWRLSDKYKFKSLKLLLFRSLDLEHWEASSDNFPNLERLVLKICDYLKEIPIDFGEICTLESIELHNCSTPAEDSARKIEQEQEDMGNNCLKVYIHRTRSFWESPKNLVDEKYKTIDFSFEAVNGCDHNGPFSVQDSYFTYVKSWSAYQTAKENGVKLLKDDVVDKFTSAWL